jgi:hypothetical protein
MSMTEEQWKRRQAGIASLPPLVRPEPISEEEEELLEPEYDDGDVQPECEPSRKPDVKLDDNLERLIDRLGMGDKPPPRLETIQARGPTAPESHPSTDEKSANKEQLSTANKISQPEFLPNGKVLMWGKLLTDKPPYYKINKKLAGCWAISNTECCLLGLLNFLMNHRGHASVSYERLAWWVRLRNTYSPKSMKQMVSKLGPNFSTTWAVTQTGRIWSLSRSGETRKRPRKMKLRFHSRMCRFHFGMCTFHRHRLIP